MPNLADKLLYFVRGLVNRKRRVALSPIRGDSTRASTITAATIHAALESARQGRTRQLMSIYREVLLSDSQIAAALATRKMAVLNHPWHVSAVDPQNADDVRAADACRAFLARIPQFRSRLGEMMESCLLPVSVHHKVWMPSRIAGLRFDLAALVPQDPQLLDWSEHEMRLENVDPVTRQPNATFELVTDHDFLIHRGHTMTTPDTAGGPIRGLLFWWLFSTQDRDWWARFLERYGAPFVVGYYPAGDEQSRWTLEAAINQASVLFGMSISDETRVDLKEASAQHGDAFKAFWEVAQKEKAKAILGQSLSMDASPQGLGNGASDLQGTVRADIEMYDRTRLAETLRDGLLAQFLEINAIPGAVPLLTFGGEDKLDSKAFAETLLTAKQAGWTPAPGTEPLIGERLGFAVVPVGAGGTPAAFAAADPSEHSAEIAQAYSALLAPAARSLRAATSPGDAQQRLATTLATVDPTKPARLVADALAAGMS